ncbi:MAG: hypothetical protein C0469_11130 [Cyanobacteria bacterium DS2.3.42]|nr:hypothetical protein [Cyanobacteria bacterium DS2.3.42]
MSTSKNSLPGCHRCTSAFPLPCRNFLSTFPKLLKQKHSQKQKRDFKLDVLFVCMGNICRSPMAEGILRRIYEQSKISGKVESAGTMDWNVGSGADPRAVSVARANGIDLEKHRARQVTVDDFENFDVIFVMDNSNAISLRKIAPAHHKHKIRLLAGAAEIADPYHSNEAAFHETYKTIYECCRQAVRNDFRD